MNDGIILIGGKTYKESDVVMLATEQDSLLYLDIRDGKIYFNLSNINKSLSEVFKPQYLYFLSNDEEVDLDKISTSTPLLFTSSNKMIQTVTYSNVRIKTIGQYRKIIASTDPKLCTAQECSKNVDAWGKRCLAKPSDDFLIKYCELVGGIDKVLIEYVLSTYDDWYNNGGQPVGKYKIKIAPDNTISIKPFQVKDSWNREEVKHNLIYCVSELAAQFGCANNSIDMKKWNNATNEWIEKNL